MSGHLFLKSTGHQPPELRQAMVDPVSAPLLYDLSKKSRGTVRAKQNNRTKEIKIQGYNPLTPLLFFRARICEALPGDMDPSACGWALSHWGQDRIGMGTGTGAAWHCLGWTHEGIICPSDA
ncbi:hypothetical protein EYF80_001577 [Liparis tanakae]|uniref:Uncharacterized protein n=1 Tax=Liparis tanakae TaxID=230148 RepID=A0A4Z2JCP6_9TELE|nr:hypothetical protein EYF80_001577 [Liparis tanakae]